MRRAALAVLLLTGFAASGAYAASTTVTNSDNCKVVHLKPGESPPGGGGMSTSITAGNGRVSGQTTTGNGVSVQSSGSGVGTSVATLRRIEIAVHHRHLDQQRWPHDHRHVVEWQLHRLQTIGQVRTR